MSPTSRIAGSTGKHHSFCAMYSLRMSVWIVPASRSRPIPRSLGRDHIERQHDRRRRVDRHRHDTRSEVDPVEQRLHILQRVDRDALTTNLPQRPRMIGVVAHQRRHVKRRRQPRLTMIEQIPEPPLVSPAVPNPANCRIVHNRPRYIDPYTPRVNGNSPGNPTGSSTPPIPTGRSSSVYNGRIGSPEIVENGASRSGARENVSRSHRSTPLNRERVAISPSLRLGRRCLGSWAPRHREGSLEDPCVWRECERECRRASRWHGGYRSESHETDEVRQDAACRRGDPRRRIRIRRRTSSRL